MTVKKQKNGRPWLGCSPCKVITLVHGADGVAKFKARTGWKEEEATTATPPAAPAAGAAPKEKKEPEPKPAATGGHAARRAARRAGA